MCCDHNPSKIDHVEACKRMMLDKDVCGGQVIMQTTMERCCSFEWSCTGNGWCALALVLALAPALALTLARARARALTLTLALTSTLGAA